MDKVLGIDVGATGIKGAIVDITEGDFISERIKYPTPNPSSIENVLDVIGNIIKDLEWEGKPFGVGFPSVIKGGICNTASNIDKSWIGFNLLQELRQRFTQNAILINDADAAGYAELEYGNLVDKQGIVILLTLGTGIGSAVFHDGILMPNTEFGHLNYKKSVTEKYASNKAREDKGLTWKEWGKELDAVINHINFIFSPDLFILGGGISKKYHKYNEFLRLRHKIVPAKLLNKAGIVGAALAMHKELMEKGVLHNV